jgi:threonine synthase
MSSPLFRVACSGCGAEADPNDPYPFRCPNSGTDEADHVMVRELELDRVGWPRSDEANPFVRYGDLMHWSYLGAIDVAEMARTLDEAVAEVDGHGFRVTPYQPAEELAGKLGFADGGGVWVKDETDNVSGSHKGRHLMGLLFHLEAVERLGLTDTASRPPLAIASCGNAALAAAVVAKAGRRELRVFVPVDADPVVVARLEDLDAKIEVCERRPGESGDPTYLRLLDALDGGALPFTCQGNLNGLAIEGGQTLAYEIADQMAGEPLDHVVVQVGGGALASAVIQGFNEAHALGAMPSIPRIHTVQTEGAHPLERAFHRVEALVVRKSDLERAMKEATAHRAAYMWPWEEEPKSIATGILDDETYDWRAVVRGMLATGGRPVVVDEETLTKANDLATAATGIPVDPTGSSGLAGLLALRAKGVIGDDDRVAVLFTGVRR